MPRYLPDTNIVVHLIRGKEPGQRINSEYRLTEAKQVPLLSVVTEGELKSLGLQFAWGAEKLQLLASQLNYFPIIQLDFPGVTDAYAELDAYSRSVGRPMGKNDIWIAATAKVTGTTLLTTDGDFDHLESKIHLIKIVA